MGNTCIVLKLHKNKYNVIVVDGWVHTNTKVIKLLKKQEVYRTGSAMHLDPNYRHSPLDTNMYKLSAFLHQLKFRMASLLMNWYNLLLQTDDLYPTDAWCNCEYFGVCMVIPNIPTL